ncbi:MAG TPA: protein kinase [Kofleriaceae bacterium]|nr:protein kinase [Kofleriaceae bacterium]
MQATQRIQAAIDGVTRELEPPAPRRIGPYRIGRELGHGGMGTVYLAVRDDDEYRTEVAIKLLHHGLAPAVARFRDERQILATLEHPGIVRLLDGGSTKERLPYLVMEHIVGAPITTWVDARNLGVRARVELFCKVCVAVAYAHGKLVIHRDIKPSNILVTEDGTPKLLDFGIAKLLDPEAGREAATSTGFLLCTPAYAAPEQVLGQPVSTATDVYALGAVLYELLAGVPAQRLKGDGLDALQAMIKVDPVRPSSVAPPERRRAIAGDLDNIVLKALHKEPGRRYASVEQLASDLQRHLDGLPVLARTGTWLYRAGKLVRRHRRVIAVTAVVLASLTAATVISAGQARRADLERARAEESRAQTEQRLRELVLLQAETSLRKDPTATLAWLKDYPIGDGDRAKVLALVDEAAALGVARHVFRPGDWAHDAMFTPDGSTVVASVRDGTLRVYDVRTGAGRTLGPPGSTADMMVMAPDGRFVVTAGRLGDITVWPLDGARPRALVDGRQVADGKLASKLKLSPNGQRVLVLREGTAPTVYPVDGGAPEPIGPELPRWMVVADGDWSRQVAMVSPNEVAVASPDGTLRPLGKTAKALKWVSLSPRGDAAVLYDGEAIWLVPFAGGPMRRLAAYSGDIRQTIWSPDEQTIAIGGELHDIKLIDVATGAVRELRGHTDTNYTLQWSHDGRRLLSASDDSTARMWTVTDGSSMVLRGHDDDVNHARFSLDESSVVTSSWDGSIRVWRVDQPGSRTLVEVDRILDLRLEGDRALVKTPREAAWWNIASGHRVPIFSWAARGLGSATVSPDGEHLLVPAADGSAELRHRTGAPIQLRGHTAALLQTRFSREGRRLYTSSRDGTLRRWDVATGAGAVVVEGAALQRGFAVAADGRIAFVQGDEVRILAPDGAVRAYKVEPDWGIWEFEPVRDRLLLRSGQRIVMIDGGRMIELPTDLYASVRYAVSPDGSRIAGALGDRTVRVWDAATGRVLDVLRGHTDLVRGVAFSPDGTRLASSSYDRTVRIWQLGTDRFRVLRGHAASVDHVEWKRAEQIVTGSPDGTLRIWDVPSLELPTTAEFTERLRHATTAVIHDDRPTTSAPHPRRN